MSEVAGKAVPILPRRLSIVVVMTCHNRVATTARCLQSLEDQDTQGVRLAVVAVNDGSTDCTQSVLEGCRLTLKVLGGDGSLFWAGGMSWAERVARTVDGVNYILWLNDDVVLDANAIRMLLEAATDHPDAVIVGATRDPESGRFSYGGTVFKAKWRFAFEPLGLSTVDQQAVGMNGNCVLVPINAARAIDGLDAGFVHSAADVDYALRARRLGIEVWQCRDSVGLCHRRDRTNPSKTFLGAWRFQQSPLGFSWRNESRLMKRHARPWWPLLLVVEQALRLLRRVTY